LLTNKKA